MQSILWLSTNIYHGSFWLCYAHFVRTRLANCRQWSKMAQYGHQNKQKKESNKLPLILFRYNNAWNKSSDEVSAQFWFLPSLFNSYLKTDVIEATTPFPSLKVTTICCRTLNQLHEKQKILFKPQTVNHVNVFLNPNWSIHNPKPNSTRISEQFVLVFLFKSNNVQL